MTKKQNKFQKCQFGYHKTQKMFLMLISNTLQWLKKCSLKRKKVYEKTSKKDTHLPITVVRSVFLNHFNEFGISITFFIHILKNTLSIYFRISIFANFKCNLRKKEHLKKFHSPFEGPHSAHNQWEPAPLAFWSFSLIPIVGDSLTGSVIFWRLWYSKPTRYYLNHAAPYEPRRTLKLYYIFLIFSTSRQPLIFTTVSILSKSTYSTVQPWPV